MAIPAAIPLIISAASTAASAYGSSKQDDMNAEQLRYQRERDALNDKRQAVQDKRQAEQDRIIENERKRKILQEMLAQAFQREQYNASQWNPAMIRQPQAGV